MTFFADRALSNKQITHIKKSGVTGVLPRYEQIVSYQIAMMYCLYATFTPCIGSYFVSHNPLDWSRAEAFCTDYCKSHLVSIHNQTQFNILKDILDDALKNVPIHIRMHFFRNQA
eukprot:69985_1